MESATRPAIHPRKRYAFSLRVRRKKLIAHFSKLSPGGSQKSISKAIRESDNATLSNILSNPGITGKELGTIKSIGPGMFSVLVSEMKEEQKNGAWEGIVLPRTQAEIQRAVKERQDWIVEQYKKNPTITAIELSKKAGVSQSVISTDIDCLRARQKNGKNLDCPLPLNSDLRAERLIGLLLEDPAISVKKLASELGTDASSVHHILRRLGGIEYILRIYKIRPWDRKRVPAGYWRLKKNRRLYLLWLTVTEGVRPLNGHFVKISRDGRVQKTNIKSLAKQYSRFNVMWRARWSASRRLRNKSILQEWQELIDSRILWLMKYLIILLNSRKQIERGIIKMDLLKDPTYKEKAYGKGESYSHDLGDIQYLSFLVPKKPKKPRGEVVLSQIVNQPAVLASENGKVNSSNGKT